ncbi:DUF6197 family protein [Streptomyces sp. H27-D2]|uniref:DUF6197 family protein n=1 Tax=Streptomyces sp. H27-D2 TaxID=3046304 RepID=UPI002DB88A46|nr:hypothetical protein [Streptomyces sp. H27-D2]MEC4016011.1 hypothetical protein [Streptomyces sp. H27-D2]
MSDLSAIFTLAAAVVRTSGHGKGRFVGPDGTVDAVGALSTAVTGKATPPDVIDGLLWDAVEYLSPRIPSMTVDEDPLERIADWNDQSETTQADVIAALEAASADAAEAAIAHVDAIATHHTSSLAVA